MNERIESLESGTGFDSFFVVAALREGTTKHGSTYLTLTVRDRTGSAAARIWDPADVCPDGLEVPGIYRITGRTETFRDELQLQIQSAKPYTPTDEEYDQLVQASVWSPTVLLDEIRLHIDTHVRAEPVRRLLRFVLEHPRVRERVGTSPAAVTNHHAYRAGLAEHTLSGMRLATLIAAHYARYYPGLIDVDLLIAGFLLHDLGKVWELEGDLATDYSTYGRLVGHIPAGAAFVADVAAELGDVPEELVWELQHLVLSHHGELEYGSPKRPKTLEAQILHYVDQIDAKTNTFAGLLSKPGWTGYQRNFGRPLLEPSELRATWTTPPPGERSTYGPGGRVRVVDTGSAPLEDDKADPEPAALPEPPEAPAQAEAPAPPQPKPSPQPPAPLQPQPPPAQVHAERAERAEALELDPNPQPDPAPSSESMEIEAKPKKAAKTERGADRCDRTLSLFDGL